MVLQTLKLLRIVFLLVFVGCAVEKPAEDNPTPENTTDVSGDTFPNLTIVGPASLLPSGTTEAVISVSTNKASTCRYSNVPDTNYDSMTASMEASSDGLLHSSTVRGLQDGQEYLYYVRCASTRGNRTLKTNQDFIIKFSVENPTPACSLSLAQTSASVNASGASSLTISVTSNGAGCAWTATSSSSWITITNGSSGNGNGTVTYSVAANTAAQSRSGTMTIAGQTFTVSQLAAACSFSLGQTSTSVNASGASSLTITVTSNGSGCSRSATSGVSWITITNGSSGNGNGTVTYSVAANTGAQRVGVITIAGQNFTVTQLSGITTITDLPSAWLKGSNTGWDSGGGRAVYSGVGVYASTNIPGARVDAASASDGQGSLWLFGGFGISDDDPLHQGEMNDLWKFNGTNWALISRCFLENNIGTYGTKNVAAASNCPPMMQRAMGWVDSSGSFYVYGGITPFTDNLNDLWKFDGTSWTWKHGTAWGGQILPVYGTRGVAAATNTPGARLSSITWTDAQNNLWLFGGYNEGKQGWMSDLWKFNGTDWIWIDGPTTSNAAGIYGTKNVSTATNRPGARGRSTVAQHNGQVFVFGGEGVDASGNISTFNDLWRFNGTTWTWIGGESTADSSGSYGAKGITSAQNNPSARASAMGLADTAGNLWIFGGYRDPLIAHNDIWKFDGANWTWMSGSSSSNQLGVYGTLGISSSNNSIGARASGASWLAPDGSMFVFGGQGASRVDADDILNDFWKIEIP